MAARRYRLQNQSSRALTCYAEPVTYHSVTLMPGEAVEYVHAPTDPRTDPWALRSHFILYDRELILWDETQPSTATITIRKVSGGS
ncbi:MAG: hypothetical protein AAF577_16245 [Pseudomonadota bacterium]